MMPATKRIPGRAQTEAATGAITKLDMVEAVEEDEVAGKDVEAVVVSRTTGPRTEDP
ncbi:hypothetical protein PF010_g24388 [Phytophthora fragariae]|uniref:Uncharacterized protein n=1 Tax=Phytophthora fragariae TaxID=53985 RepID=A0A6A3F124_9STRA|nr:hypothetical protein PF003_g35420 [Phytophthora fragariae]KAE8939425.1 hypothetical protein PF009_g10726 [Phytophthora fragariae]KAE9075225.1 hypothetical protein PF010_g24388 [Phytophthora fragariae]KAE9116327.1 hypothetical protein PF007_g9701 [Phytophthora fragariae]KAE9124156.1 hypothetical protein PF006_g17259 [Phytophthora fragariae]